MSGEVTVLVLVVALRWMGVHASSLSMRRCFTFMLLLWMAWPSPVWLYAGPLAWQWPLCPPKKKTEAEKLVEARAQVNEFLQQHDRVPVWGDAVAEGSALYNKLRKAKLLHVLNEADRGVLQPVNRFWMVQGRLPKRGQQRGKTEQNLAQQWERLVRDREKLPRDLQLCFVLWRMPVGQCSRTGVSLCGNGAFFETSGRLPRRQQR